MRSGEDWAWLLLLAAVIVFGCILVAYKWVTEDEHIRALRREGAVSVAMSKQELIDELERLIDAKIDDVVREEDATELARIRGRIEGLTEAKHLIQRAEG